MGQHEGCQDFKVGQGFGASFVGSSNDGLPFLCQAVQAFSADWLKIDSNPLIDTCDVGAAGNVLISQASLYLGFSAFCGSASACGQKESLQYDQQIATILMLSSRSHSVMTVNM